jgi:hypothetical protein
MAGRRTSASAASMLDDGQAMQDRPHAAPGHLEAVLQTRLAGWL